MWRNWSAVQIRDCSEAPTAVGVSNSALIFDTDVVFVRVFPIDNASQRLVIDILKPRNFRLRDYLLLAGLKAESRVIDKMYSVLCWPHMAYDVDTAVKDRLSCARHSHNKYKQCRIRRLPSSGPIEYLAMNVLGPLLKTKSGNQFIEMLTDHYSYLTMVTRIAGTRAMTVPAILVDDWISNFGELTTVQTD